VQRHQSGHILKRSDGSQFRHAIRMAVLSACILAAAIPNVSSAYPARETFIKEEGHLHLAHKASGSAIAEQGSATGTFSASLRAEIAIKVSQVSGSVQIELKNGTITGQASATPHFSGRYVTFKGTLTIKHGTGSYHGASGTAGFYGAFDRTDYALAVQLIGRLHL
jgi:hypothetical protein